MAEAYASLASSLSDRYAIDRELGRGGMATVYLAQDRKHDRKIAIKVLRADLLVADLHAVLELFMSARALSAVGGEGVTEGGLALGTPEYMSPEQASGEQDLGGRSDLYSLACVIYEMLAGEPPLRGRGARATMAKQVTATPRPLRALRPDAPARVERVLARAS